MKKKTHSKKKVSYSQNYLKYPRNAREIVCAVVYSSLISAEEMKCIVKINNNWNLYVHSDYAGDQWLDELENYRS